MTAAEAKTLQPGDAVRYHDRPATVAFVRCNGVTVGYWGTGLRAGEYVTHRVPAAYLSRP